MKAGCLFFYWGCDLVRPQQIIERQQIQVKDEPDRSITGAYGSERYSTGYGPGDQRSADDGTVFQVEGQLIVICGIVLMQLIGKDTAEGLVAGRHTGDSSS